MTRRWREITVALAALLVAAALLVGLPVLLLTMVGWPLATWDQTVDAVEALQYGQLDPALVIAILAAVVWISWLQLVTAMVIEIIAAARGMAARRRPVLTGVMQPLASRLVSAALLLTTAFGVRPAAAVSAATPAPASAPPVAPAVPATQIAAAAAEQDREPEFKTVTVRRHDTLWGIAERELGDGRRWREIHRLNVGRPQPSGYSLQPGSDAIDVGWELRIPADGASAHADTASEYVTVDPGDSLSLLADEHLDDADRWPDLFEENKGRPQPGGGALTDPDLIRPGWLIDVDVDNGAGPQPSAEHEDMPEERAGPEGEVDDPVDRPRPTASPPAPQAPEDVDEAGGTRDRLDASDRVAGAGGGAAASPAPSGIEPDASRQSARPTPSESAAAEPGHGTDRTDGSSRAGEDGAPNWWWPAAGLVGAGVAATIARLLRIWLRRRQFGATAPDVTADATHDTASQAAKAPGELPSLRGRAGVAVRAFVTLHATAPSIAGVTINPDGTIGLLLEDAAPEHLDAGFVRDRDDPRVVLLPAGVADDQLEPLAARTAAAASTLVTLGVGVRSGELLLLALESCECLAVDGPEQMVEQTMLAWAIELATSEYAAALDVWMVGFDAEIADASTSWERLHAVASGGDAIDGVRRHAVGDDSPDQLPDRGDDDWVPQVVICGPHLDREDVEQVLGFASLYRSAGVITIVPGDVPSAPWRLTITEREVLVTSLRQQIVLTPIRRVSRDEFAALTGLVHRAKSTAAQTLDVVDDPTARHATEMLSSLRADAGPLTDTTSLPSDLVVARVLGPVTIETPDAHTVAAGRTTEAVAYLACHRTGVSGDRLIDVFWNGRAVDRARLAELLSRARTAIGGVDRLPRAGIGRGYRVADTVVTDLHIVGWHVQQAQRDIEQLEAHLSAALSWVRGRPFDAVDWVWPLWDGSGTAAAAFISDVAATLGQWYLEQDRPADALAAARAGAAAAPESEQLVRLQMRAHYVQGEIEAIRSVWMELRERVDADAGPDGDDQLHPATVELYRQLTSRARASASS